ncbi:hypothetical protein HDU96_001429 [Phlyctochytrium bullatum]|nr:hypothetical protein HDU96_001429 [Phlyctochytrium bullatum]
MPYLYACHEVETLESSFDDDKPLVDVTLLRKPFLDHFPKASVIRIEIYTACLYAKRWKTDMDRTDLLEKAVYYIMRLSHPVIRNGITAFVFESILSPWLSRVTEIVERGRKAPRAEICIKFCGSKPENAVKVFDVCLSMLQENVLTTDPGYTSLDDIRHDFDELISSDVVARSESFANSFIGEVFEFAEAAGDSGRIDQ